jgi:hypothetical protein
MQGMLLYMCLCVCVCSRVRVRKKCNEKDIYIKRLEDFFLCCEGFYCAKDFQIYRFGML